MIRSTIFAGLAIAGLATAVIAQPMNGPMDHPMNGSGPQSPRMGGPDMGGHTMDFITKAAQSDEFERREGRLAATRSHNHHVRDFAKMMVRAHTQTTADLKMAIRSAGMTPPPPPALTDDQMRMMDDLKHAHGPDFDKTYIDQQVQAHQMALDLMQGYAQNGRPSPIRDAAAKTAPLVQQHLDMAKDIQSHIG